jgi:hypothetical protein
MTPTRAVKRTVARGKTARLNELELYCEDYGVGEPEPTL